MLLCIPLADDRGLESVLARGPRNANWFLIRHSSTEEFTLMSREDFLAADDSLQAVLFHFSIHTLITSELQPMAMKVLRNSGVSVLLTDAGTAGQALAYFDRGWLREAGPGSGFSCGTAHCRTCHISSCPAH